MRVPLAQDLAASPNPCGIQAAMADVKAQRRLWVQELRIIAGRCQVRRVSDNASRADVNKMVEAVFGKPNAQMFVNSTTWRHF